MKYPFSNFKKFPWRNELITELCRNKRVLHVGACDSPYHQLKFSDGSLLHPKLEEVAKDVLGVDVDEDAINWLKKQGVKSIQHLDIQTMSPREFEPEIIVFGETIEHLENPGLALQQLRRLMHADTRLVISTPNLFSILWQFMVLLGYEELHEDHRVGFTPGLLCQLLDKVGFSTESVYFTHLDRSNPSMARRFVRAVASVRMGWRETMVIVARPQ